MKAKVSKVAFWFFSSKVDDAQINQFQNSLHAARQRVIQRRMGSFKQIEQVINLVRKTELLEKSLLNKVGSVSSEGLWIKQNIDS